MRWIHAQLITLILSILISGFSMARSTFPLPEFTHQNTQDWINSEPLSIKELRGFVTLIDVWTFDCWNCYRSFPWLNAVVKKYQNRRFSVIGVHTPEFDHEKVRWRVEEKADEYGLDNAIMLDNDFSYWKALGNRVWPTYYLVDKKGRVRHIFYGETHEGDQRALRIEYAIDELLAEP